MTKLEIKVTNKLMDFGILPDKKNIPKVIELIKLIETELKQLPTTDISMLSAKL